MTTLHKHHSIFTGLKQGRLERLLPIFSLLLAVNSLHPTLALKQSPFTYRSEWLKADLHKQACDSFQNTTLTYKKPDN